MGRQRFRAGWKVCIARKHKLKGGATPLVRARPEASAMRLDDRTADREAQPQAGALRRVEGFETRAAPSTPLVSFVVLISNSLGPSLAAPIASSALTIKLRSTCCN